MILSECQVGESVWARVGTYGWRPAVVEGVGRRWVRVRFLSGQQSQGTRGPGALRPRDPNRRGKDKPSPAEAEQAYHNAEG